MVGVAPGLCLPCVLVLLACQPPVVRRQDAGIDGLPVQQCQAGWVAARLEGPQIASAAVGPPRASPLVLASGLRRLRSASTEAVAGCAAGCLMLAHVARSVDWRRLTRQGLRRVEHLQGQHFIVALEPGARPGADVLALDWLRPADKLPPPAPGAPADSPKRLGRVVHGVDPSGQRWTRSFEALGLPLSAVGEQRAAAMPWVYRVAVRRMPDRELTADVRRSTHTAELQGFTLTPDGTASYSGHTGRGITVAVVDSGVDSAHLDLHDFDATGQDTGSRVTGDPETGFHGTAVASVLAGNGHNSAAFTSGGVASAPFAWRGQAPAATLISIYKGAPWVPAMLPAMLSNHSYALSYGTYDNNSAFVDRVIHDGLAYQGHIEPPRPMIWGAGNAGLIPGAPNAPAGYHSLSAVAKNPIVVGGSNANDDAFCPWASHGPTYDGRIKPDLVAPYGKDYRPPAGIPIAIDEIRLRARAGSGTSDVVWSFDQDGDPEGWTVAPGIQAPLVQAGALTGLATLGGDTAPGPLPLLGGGTLSWSALPLDGENHDVLQLRMRLQVAQVPGRYRWPNLWVVRFTDANGQDHELLVPFDPARQDDGWHIHQATLPPSFTGAITRLQIDPVSYLDGIVAAATGSQGYQIVVGTSFAAPVVSGAAALLLQQLQPEEPWPATLKALLIHTARDLVHEQPDPRDRNNPDTGAPTLLHEGPDFASGFGLLDAAAASSLLAVSSRTPTGALHSGLQSGSPAPRARVEQTIGAGQIHRYRVVLGAGVTLRQLKATLAWDDLPGNPLLALDQPQLVNDLDLVAVAPSGLAHGPWVLDPLPLTAITPSDVKPARRCVEPAPWTRPDCQDHRNNVEQVVVEQPEPGAWTILVRAHDVLDSPQRYALIVSARCD